LTFARRARSRYLQLMGPGGYQFGDCWRMGLPLEILVLAAGVPMILVVWPIAAPSCPPRRPRPVATVPNRKRHPRLAPR
jgi:hypothetical protein